MMPRSERYRPALGGMGGCSRARFVGLDVSQKLTAVCVVDETGRRVWRGQSATDPELIGRAARGHAGEDAPVGPETGPMTPWFVHELRGRGFDVICLDARHARAALKMQLNRSGPWARDHVAESSIRAHARLQAGCEGGRWVPIGIAG